MGRGDQLLGKEKASFNLARLKTGGETFEVVVHPELALDFKHGKNVNVRDTIVHDKIYADAQRGMLASEHMMEKIFDTSDPTEIIKAIIKKGDIQLTGEYREKLRTEKRNRIIHLISRNGIDPKTSLPHPPQRIENALAEAKVQIDEHKLAEDQIQEILKKIRTVLPIRFEVREVEIHIPASYASKSYALLKSYGTVLKDEWQNDGSLLSVIELPAGLQQDFFSELNSITHGNVETKVIRTK